MIVSKLSDGFRCGAQFKGMEMCLWKPNSSERYCVIFILLEDKAPSDSALILRRTQAAKLKPLRLCWKLQSSRNKYNMREDLVCVCVWEGERAREREAAWEGHVSLCACIPKLRLDVKFCIRKVSARRKKAPVRLLVLTLAPYFLPPGQVESASLPSIFHLSN